MEEYFFNRLASVIYRQGNSFFDKELADTPVGTGQQFFLLLVYENPGISALDLAKQGRFDKGTVTKAVQKLIAQECIRWESDEKDGRIRHLYATEKGERILDEVRRVREAWNTILVQGMTAEEIAQADQLLKKMAENAYCYKKDLQECEEK